MKHLIVAVTSLALLSIASPTLAVDASISPLCDGSDNGYNRPGGYCSQVASNASIILVGGPVDPCKKNPDLSECEV